MLKEKGYCVVQMWECEWSRMKGSGSVKVFVDGLRLVDPLEPRDAFYG